MEARSDDLGSFMDIANRLSMKRDMQIEVILWVFMIVTMGVTTVMTYASTIGPADTRGMSPIFFAVYPSPWGDTGVHFVRSLAEVTVWFLPRQGRRAFRLCSIRMLAL